MKLSSWFLPKTKKKQSKDTTGRSLVLPEQKGRTLPASLAGNRQEFDQAFGGSIDFHQESVQVCGKQALLLYLDTMCALPAMQEQLRKPLAVASVSPRPMKTEQDLDALRKDLFAGTMTQLKHDLESAVKCILTGYAVLIVEGIPAGLCVLINDIDHRPVEEPSTQTIVRGPKDGFSENLSLNLSLVRRRMKNPRLQFESYTIGKDTNTEVVLGYISGVINEDVLDEVRKRLRAVRASGLFDSGNLEELIQDKTFTPFPTIYNTERPDSIAAHLLDGKFAIFVEGSPFVLAAPTVMTDFFQSPEDYYQPWFMATFVRLVRYLSFFIALMLPAFYLAVITFHQELLPTQLIISLASQREGVPFPAVVETLMMEMTFEIIREAGIRMPRAVGQTVSIVGALVIGQAAVEAGIVSNTLVIVVALTGLSSFASPVYAMALAVRILRFILILLASVFGLYGVVLGLIMMVAHLTSLRSFGVPYLSPVAPLNLEDMDDVFIRFPMWAIKHRPHYLDSRAPLKNPDTKSPSPPKKGGDRS